MGWVANSAFWVGYIADLGPYVGPWPPPIPPPQALLIAAGEVDYVIGVPDSGTSSGLAGDVYLDLYRFWNSTPGDYFNTGYTWVDGGVTPGDPANHLFVTFYNPAFADPSTYSPSVDPEQLVPSWMAAGGTLPVPEPSSSPTWSAIPDGAGWGTGGHFWLADLGPYIGPWPPAPPIPANLPYDYGSVPFPPAPSTYLYVDYLITTSNAAAIIAGSNDGYDLYRWPTTTNEIGSMLGSARPSLPGQHLWVTVRMGARTDEPSYSPLSMAPALYVEGGLGVQLGDPSAGHWSAPLAYPTGLESYPSFTITNPGLPKTGLMPGSSTPGHVSPVGLETTASQACYGSVPSNPHSDDGQAEFGIGFQTGNFPDFTSAPFGVDEIRQTDLRLQDNWGYNFYAVQNIYGDAAGHIGTWGVEGIDYVAQLGDPNLMTVDSVDGTETAWRSWVSMSVNYTASAAFNSGNYLVGYATTGTYQFGWYLLGGFTANNAWLLDASGTPVATTNVTVATNANHTTSSVAGTEVIDLSSAPISCQVTLKPMNVSVGQAPLDLDTTATGTGSADIDWRIHPDAMTATASISYSDMHFWVPPTPVYPQPSAVGVHYLRMTQRDDGLGIHRHPRLPVTSMPTSVQLSRAPRIGHNNRYS